MVREGGPPLSSWASGSPSPHTSSRTTDLSSRPGSLDRMAGSISHWGCKHSQRCWGWPVACGPLLHPPCPRALFRALLIWLIPLVKAMVFPVVMCGCESWTIKKAELKNWCFWTVVLKKALESPLDCKEIQPVHPKGDQSWIFFGRNDADTVILWPPDVKNRLTGKDPDSGKDWRWEEKGTTENEMVGWHHQWGGHEFEQALGVGDGQGSLMCYSPWGHKESDATERLNRTELNLTDVIPSQIFSPRTVISISTKHGRYWVWGHSCWRHTPCPPVAWTLSSRCSALDRPAFLLLLYLAVFLDIKSFYVPRNGKAE